MGRDFISQLIILVPQSFNPRARMGRDTPKGKIAQAIVVSTHAPAWGATYEPNSYLWY